MSHEAKIITEDGVEVPVRCDYTIRSTSASREWSGSFDADGPTDLTHMHQAPLDLILNDGRRGKIFILSVSPLGDNGVFQGTGPPPE